MSKSVYYRCDVCSNEFTTEAHLQSVTIAIRNAVRAKESLHIHHEHVCVDCTQALMQTVNVNEEGVANLPRPFNRRHEPR